MPVVRPAHVQLLDYEIELGLVLRAPVPAGTQVGPDDLPQWLAGRDALDHGQAFAFETLGSTVGKLAFIDICTARTASIDGGYGPDARKLRACRSWPLQCRSRWLWRRVLCRGIYRSAGLATSETYAEMSWSRRAPRGKSHPFDGLVL
jgi:hypothetical protein